MTIPEIAKAFGSPTTPNAFNNTIYPNALPPKGYGPNQGGNDLVYVNCQNGAVGSPARGNKQGQALFCDGSCTCEFPVATLNRPNWVVQMPHRTDQTQPSSLAGSMDPTTPPATVSSSWTRSTVSWWPTTTSPSKASRPPSIAASLPTAPPPTRAINPRRARPATVLSHPRCPPLAFPTLNASQLVCIVAGDPQICLPSGSYDSQSGAFGYDFSKTNAAHIPTGASIGWQTVHGPDQQHGDVHVDVANYTTPVDPPNNSAFLEDVLKFAPAGNQYGGTTGKINVTNPVDPPLLCLYSKINYGGDVVCMAPGGGDIPNGAANKTQSGSISGGAIVELFQGFYGNIVSYEMTTNEPDFSKVPWGATANLANQIASAWVQPPG